MAGSTDSALREVLLHDRKKKKSGSTIPETALGYKFDIVLRGRDETPMENYLPAR